MNKLNGSVQKHWAQLRLFLEVEEGASGIEYALLAAMVAAVLAAFVTPVGDQIVATMNDILTALGGVAI